MFSRRTLALIDSRTLFSLPVSVWSTNHSFFIATCAFSRTGMNDLDEYIDLADQKMYEMRVIRDKHRRK